MSGSKDVHEQDGQHHALGIGRIDHPDQHHQKADEESIDVATRIRSGRGDRIGRHEDHPEGPTAEHQVPIKRHVEEQVGLGTDGVQERGRRDRANETPDMTRHEPTPVMRSTTSPSKTARAEVSPIDPGIKPKKASHQVNP